MIKKKILFVILIYLTACGEYDDKTTFHHLQGDWVATNGEYTLCFYDSICSYSSLVNGEFTKFFIRNDTLNCFPIKRDKHNYSIVQFKLLKLKDDSLRLTFPYLRGKEDTIDFAKTKNVLGTDVVIDSLRLITRAGLGKYPSIEVNFNSKGDFNYEGKGDVSLLGKYRGVISKSELKFLEEKFRCIDYKKILQRPDVGCFGPLTNIIIYVQNKTSGYKKTFNISNFYSFDEPAELRIFINYVMNLPKHIRLVAIETIK